MDDVSLEAKLAFLARPESYPERPARVEIVETHMSCVFLLERHAYKLKKPVRRDFLDFSTVEARLADSTEELRLNRRLSPDVYLGIVALTRDVAGRLALAGEGHVVDWLVRMRRLPAERMLDRALASGRACLDDARRLGAVLARFYGRERPIAFAGGAYHERLVRDVRASAAELRRTDDVDCERVAAVERDLLAFLEGARDAVERRAGERRIVEVHGDLRPEHVDLGPPVLVIDCLEFNRDMRILDPLDELGFLALECELRGAPWFGEAVLESYARTARDPAPPGLVGFYRSSRAFLRAKLAAWHTREPGSRGAAHWRERSGRYLAHAERLSRAGGSETPRSHPRAA
jgi:aminoglycoside phosphotransferase family enzyme